MGKTNRKRPEQNGPDQMRLVFPNAAGIDVGADAALRGGSAGARRRRP